MIKVPLIPLQGAQVLSLVKELKIPWPGGGKKKAHGLQNHCLEERVAC